MFAAIAALWLLPLVNPLPAASFVRFIRPLAWFGAGNGLLLGVLGAAALGTPNNVIGRWATGAYFGAMLGMAPAAGFAEAGLSVVSLNR